MWSSVRAMMRDLLVVTFLSLALAPGCRGDQKPPKSAASAEKTRKTASSAGAKKAKSEQPQPKALPTECVTLGDMCFPPSDFVDRLCARNHPDVAVYMMGPGQPWTHRYVRVEEAQAVNPITGRVGAAKLTFGEEIIVLRYRKGAVVGPIQVTGTERYEVLRWDGSCAALEEGEFVEKVPEQQRRYVVPTWTRISDGYRKLLLEQSAVAEADERRKADCKGAGLGRPPKCHKAIEALNRTVAEVVHEGIELPLPEPIP